MERLELSEKVIVQCFHGASLDELRACKPDLKLLALYRHDIAISENKEVFDQALIHYQRRPAPPDIEDLGALSPIRGNPE